MDKSFWATIVGALAAFFIYAGAETAVAFALGPRPIPFQLMIVGFVLLLLVAAVLGGAVAARISGEEPGRPLFFGAFGVLLACWIVLWAAVAGLTKDVLDASFATIFGFVFAVLLLRDNR